MSNAQPRAPEDGPEAASARSRLADRLGLEPSTLHELTQQSIEVLLGVIETARTQGGTRHPIPDGGLAGKDLGEPASADERDVDANRRDLAAEVRDVAAELRDQAARDLDRVAGRRAASDRRYATVERARGVSGGAEAANNRAKAVNDREVAAEDRLRADKDHEDQDLWSTGTDPDAFAAAGEREIERRKRDLAAQQRDVAAGLRDSAAERRAASDRKHTADGGARAASGGTGAAQSRAQAMNDRKVAADDRALGSRDRRVAAEDRARAARDREDAGIDELTGVLRRRAGLAAIDREVDRARRMKVEIVAAFVDVDGLKTENDTRGHAAGDSLLVAVARALRASLRTYDVITRVGGDEYVCVLSGISVENARARFEAASANLMVVRPGASITVGFAQLQADESADDMIHRADSDLMRVRSRR